MEPPARLGGPRGGHRRLDPHPPAARGAAPRTGGSARLKRLRTFAALVLAGAATPAVAGPPYLTDDPVPTDVSHWEIYAFTGGEGRGSTIDDESGVDLNYGPVKGVQLTATLPLAFTRDSAAGWRGGTGDVELGIKYRFFHDE